MWKKLEVIRRNTVSGTGSAPVWLKLWSMYNPLVLIGKAVLSIQVKYDDDDDDDDDDSDTMMKLRNWE